MKETAFRSLSFSLLQGILAFGSAEARRFTKDILVGGLATVILLIGAGTSSAEAALAPATFDEYVGIAWYSIQGASVANPESVDLSVGLGQTEDRGSGTGHATTNGVLPVPSELDLWLFGGTNLSGIGGTAAVQTRYQFSLNPMAAGLPQFVPITLTTSGWVRVESNLLDGLVGQTFARIDHPGGQSQASNEDPFGGHNGFFSFDETIALTVAADSAQTISIYLYSHGQGAGTEFFYHGHSFLDPVIQIDPAFEFRDQFRVVYSQGIRAAIPEPETYAMLLAGLGLLGFAARRKKHKAA